MAFEGKKSDHIIWIDDQSLEVHVKHDVDVSYKPGQELSTILEEVSFIRKKRKRYLDELQEDLKKILDLINSYNYKNNSIYKEKIDKQRKEENKKNKKKKKESLGKRVLGKFKRNKK